MPCAGKSTRFSQVKPKWMLTHPNGNLMVMESLNGLNLNNVSSITITVVKEHIETTGIDLDILSDKIEQMTSIRPDFLILNQFTASQSETVYQTIISKNIKGPIFIKDCDNYFSSTIGENNSVCISTLQSNINAVNKSYVCLDKFGNLSGIVEKKVIGDKFCVGGYSFSNAKDFVKSFEKLLSTSAIDRKEIYISHIIQDMLLSGIEFNTVDVSKYDDWGTIEDWNKYIQQFKTIFVDLDGVLVENSSEFFKPFWGDSSGLQDNINLINDYYETNKSIIVIVTSRKEEYKNKTIVQLAKLGIKYHQIIFNLPHAQRILINDYSRTNPYPSAIAICVKRDDDNLKELVKK
jgi:hypothetical protein